MSVYVDLHINDEQLGAIAITRMSSAGGTPDAINTYRWHYQCDGHQAVGDLVHRYGDGAVVLAHKVLAAIVKHQAPEPTLEVPSIRVPQRIQPQWSGA